MNRREQHHSFESALSQHLKASASSVHPVGDLDRVKERARQRRQRRRIGQGLAGLMVVGALGYGVVELMEPSPTEVAVGSDESVSFQWRQTESELGSVWERVHLSDGRWIVTTDVAPTEAEAGTQWWTQVMISDDGEHWEPQHRFEGGLSSIVEADGSLFAVHETLTEHALTYSSDDAIATESQLDENDDATAAGGGEFDDQGDAAEIYSSYEQRIIRSDDAGQNWAEVSLPELEIRSHDDPQGVLAESHAVYTTVSDGDTLYLQVTQYPNYNTDRLAELAGVDAEHSYVNFEEERGTLTVVDDSACMPLWEELDRELQSLGEHAVIPEERYTEIDALCAELRVTVELRLADIGLTSGSLTRRAGLYSRDGGQTWDRFDSPGDVMGAAHGWVYAAEYSDTGGPPRYYRSANTQDWEPMDLGDRSVYLDGIRPLGSAIVATAGADQWSMPRVAISHDQGASWEYRAPWTNDAATTSGDQWIESWVANAHGIVVVTTNFDGHHMTMSDQMSDGTTHGVATTEIVPSTTTSVAAGHEMPHEDEHVMAAYTSVLHVYFSPDGETFHRLSPELLPQAVTTWTLLDADRVIIGMLHEDGQSSTIHIGQRN